jgi:hypothetical protein
MEGTEMAGRCDDTLAILAAILLIFAATLNPSGVVAIVLLLHHRGGRLGPGERDVRRGLRANTAAPVPAAAPAGFVSRSCSIPEPSFLALDVEEGEIEDLTIC